MEIAAEIQSTKRQFAQPAEDVCNLYVVRHGTTTMNVQNRYRGRADVPLDAQGYQDAVDAARRLSTAGLTAVYTGPLRRTIATAQIIADEARVPDIRILHGLVNLDYGDWEGQTAVDAEVYDPAAFELYRTDPEHAMCPNGERLRDATDRMIQAMELIGSRHQGEAVAAVSHAVMIRLAVARLNNVVGEAWRTPVGRGSVTGFRIESDGTIALVHAPSGGVPDSAPTSG